MDGIKFLSDWAKDLSFKFILRPTFQCKESDFTDNVLYYPLATFQCKLQPKYIIFNCKMGKNETNKNMEAWHIQLTDQGGAALNKEELTLTIKQLG